MSPRAWVITNPTAVLHSIVAFHNLETVSKSDTTRLRSKHQRTLDAIFERPTRLNIHWHDIESLFRALGATITERSGSAVMVDLNGVTIGFHRPHPGRDAKRYQVEATREFLRTAGAYTC